MINLTIDGTEVSVEEGASILDAARKANVKIPTLCYHPDQTVKAVCRICVVEVEGMPGLQASCSTPASEGMVVKTASPKVIRARKDIMELIMARHPMECLGCQQNGRCELQNVAASLNMSKPSRYPLDIRKATIDNTSPSIVRDMQKCILCGRCEETCSDVQEIMVMAKENRGYYSMMVPPYGKKLVDTPCVNCGQCVQVCPTGAITVKDDTEKVYSFMDQDKVMVASIAPSVRVNLAEALGEEPGTVSTGRMITALRKIGFDRVFDTDFAADLTIMEEGSELLDRIQNGGTLPMFTSCCPAWIKYAETFYPEHLDNLSSCKSPMEMFGPLIKTYFAEKVKIEPSKICSVAIMPCTAKKFECQRDEMNASGYQDIDVVLTVQELARMIQTAGIDFKNLEEGEFDNPFGLGSGAGLIFGATGGVMEAALRTVYEKVTGKEMDPLDFTPVRGFEGIKEASVDLDGTVVKVAVAHGLGNARKILQEIGSGRAQYHFVEIMACPGGCIGGGGNAPRTWAKVEERKRAIYEEEKRLPVRKSHENPWIQQIYKEYLGAPLGEKSHQLLHTHYVNRHDLLGS